MMKSVSPLGQVHSLGDFLSAYYVSDTDLALRIRGEQDRQDLGAGFIGRDVGDDQTSRGQSLPRGTPLENQFRGKTRLLVLATPVELSGGQAGGIPPRHSHGSGTEAKHEWDFPRRTSGKKGKYNPKTV